VLFLAACGLVASFILGWCSILALLLIFNLAYAFVMLWLTRGERVYSDVLFDTIVEGNLICSQFLAYGVYLAGVA
jgi:hypothetical protein